jgi:small subunit ribosomal protein S6
MNNYETVFILTPVLSDSQMKEAVEKIKELLTSQGAAIVNEENWGLRKLAYPIQKKTTGFYQLIEFKAEPTIVEVLETQFRRDERVIRFLTFRQDKFAAEYSEKRRSLKLSPKEEMHEKPQPVIKKEPKTKINKSIDEAEIEEIELEKED